MPCFLSCKSKSVFAKPLEHQCSAATISPSLWQEPGMDLRPPRAGPPCFVLPRCPLDGCYVIPGLVVARTVATMHCIEDPNLRLTRRIQDLQHM